MPAAAMTIPSAEMTLTFKFTADGRYEQVVSVFGGAIEITYNGTARIEGTKLFLTLEDFGDLEVEFEFTLEGNKLTTTNSNAWYDFDGNGNDEPATEVTVYVKT